MNANEDAPISQEAKARIVQTIKEAWPIILRTAKRADVAAQGEQWEGMLDYRTVLMDQLTTISGLAYAAEIIVEDLDEDLDDAPDDEMEFVEITLGRYCQLRDLPDTAELTGPSAEQLPEHDGAYRLLDGRLLFEHKGDRFVQSEDDMGGL